MITTIAAAAAAAATGLATLISLLLPPVSARLSLLMMSFMCHNLLRFPAWPGDCLGRVAALKPPHLPGVGLHTTITTTITMTMTWMMAGSPRLQIRKSGGKWPLKKLA
jgi:hypothetical protein